MKRELFPLSLRKKLKLMEAYPQYAYAYTTDMTKPFFHEIEDKLSHKKNIILEIVGETGSGKSYAGFTVAIFCNSCFNKPVTINNFAFTNTDFLELVTQLKVRNTIIKDEQPRAIYGEGSVIEQVTMQDIEEVVRKAQLNMIFISPESRSFHTGVHFILQTFDLDYEKRENLLLVHPSTDHNLRVPIGHIILKHPLDVEPKFKKTLDAYESRKDVFISDATNQTSRAKFFQKLRIKAEHLANDPVFVSLSKGKRKAYLYLKYPTLSSQLSQSLVDTVINMSGILIKDKENKI